MELQLIGLLYPYGMKYWALKVKAVSAIWLDVGNVYPYFLRYYKNANNPLTTCNAWPTSAKNRPIWNCNSCILPCSKPKSHDSITQCLYPGYTIDNRLYQYVTIVIYSYEYSFNSFNYLNLIVVTRLVCNIA